MGAEIASNEKMYLCPVSHWDSGQGASMQSAPPWFPGSHSSSAQNYLWLPLGLKPQVLSRVPKALHSLPIDTCPYLSILNNSLQPHGCLAAPQKPGMMLPQGLCSCSLCRQGLALSCSMLYCWHLGRAGHTTGTQQMLVG